MQRVTKLGFFSISVGWENDKAILVLKYRGPYSEPIKLLYQDSSSSEELLWKDFQLSSSEKKAVPLPEAYKNWEVLYVQINGPRKTIRIKELEKLLDTTKRQQDTEKSTANPKLSNNSPEFSEKSSNPPEQGLRFKNQKIRKNTPISGSVELGSRALPKLIHQESDKRQNQQLENLQAQIVKLAQSIADLESEIVSLREQNQALAKEVDPKAPLDGSIDFISSDLEQVFHKAANRVLQMEFTQQKKITSKTFQDPILVCEAIKTELGKFKEQLGEQKNYTLSAADQQLAKVKELIRFELSEIPSLKKFWENQPKELAELVLADELLEAVQFSYFGKLGKTYWEDLKTYKAKLPQTIVETQSILTRTVFLLVDGLSPYRAHNSEETEVARSFYKEHLPNILQIAGLELVPIEIGQTKADARIHDIQGTQSGAFKRGVVADIIQHGVRRASDQKIIKKPVVMRGEPEQG